MPYSASISVQSITSINSKRSQLSLRSLPGLWRRFVLFVCPHLNPSFEELVESSPQAFLKEVPQVREDYLMSGALPDDDTCQDNPQRPPCVTGSCLTPMQREFNVKRKPLPQLRDPAAIRNTVDKRASLDDIRPVIEAFTREVDTVFLSSTAKLVLRHLKKLTETPQTSTRVLVQLDAGEPIWMNAKDADILYQLRQITNSLPQEDKWCLLEDVASLVDPRAKYPLRQVMFHGVNIKPDAMERLGERADRQSWLDVSGLLEEGESIEEAKAALRPSPLVVPKRQQSCLRESETVSSVAEWDEHTPTSPDDANSSSTSTVVLGDAEQQDVPSPVPATHSSSPEISVARPRGNVRNGRLAAEEVRRTMTSENGQTSRRTTPITSPVQTPRASKSGSTFIPPEDFFVNPRKAPLPPTRPGKRLLAHRALKLLKLPRTPARSQAVEALDATSEPNSPRPSTTASERKPGSIHQAREALRHKQPGSVREARQKLDPSLVELPLPPAGPESPHVRHPRSSSLPRKPQGAGKVNRQLDKSASLPHFGPHVVVRPTLRGGAISRSAYTEASEELVRGKGTSKRPYAVNKDAASARPSPARTLTVQDSPYRPHSSHGILVTRHTEVERNTSGLRGGASGNSDVSIEDQGRRRRVTTIFGGRVDRLQDHERPHSGIWWLAGGRVGRRSRIPTAAELRERRRVEEANREIVGFGVLPSASEL